MARLPYAEIAPGRRTRPRTDHLIRLVLIRLLIFVFLAFFVAVCAVPFLWTIFSSFKTSQGIFTSALALPDRLHWENYAHALTITNMPTAYLNSIIVTVFSVVLNASAALLAAYALARFHFRGRQLILFLLYLGVLVPINSAVLPIKVIMDRLHLTGSLPGLIILYAAIGIPISVLLLRAHIQGIPNEIDESARVDGASFWGVLGKIIGPIARPGLVTIAILQMIYSWNEFLFAIILINAESKRTLQIAIRFFLGRFSFDYGGLFAAMVLAIAPTVIIFIIFQNTVVSALSAGAVKR